jgi:hypothetical protein
MPTKLSGLDKSGTARVNMATTKTYSIWPTMILLAFLNFALTEARAQTINSSNAGYSGAWASSTTIDGSAILIDASAAYFASTATDICSRIAAVLAALTATGSAYPQSGVVIDARAVPVTSAHTCSGNPWASPPTGGWPPTTVLLPAGSIVITSPWVLPNETRIIGEGRGKTTIQASSSFSGTAMIEMGGSSVCPSGSVCTGVVVADLFLSGYTTNTYGGIYNEYSRDSSYVEHVTISQIGGTGLLVGSSGTSGIDASNSGPYNDLFITAGSATQNVTPQTACAIITVPSRGIHGLTCIACDSPTCSGISAPPFGVQISGNNNSLEDYHVEGYADGVQVAAGGVVVSNVSGVKGGNSGPVTNVIHLCNTTTCTSVSTAASDVSLLGINAYTGATNVIQDDLTSTTLAESSTPYAALYVLGEAGSGTSGGYSRFSSVPATTPTWISAGSTVSGSCSNPGTIYSNTAGSSSSTNSGYVCAAGTWKAFF